MRTITKYRANDGSEHETADSAIARDELHAKVQAVMAHLPEPPEEVEAGKGWAQHDLETVNTCKDQILELCRAEGFAKHYPVFNHAGRDCHPLSIIGRVLDDYGGPLNLAWLRFSRIDVLGREHQQCYFAYTNGPAPKHVCVADFTSNTNADV